ncbi:MAG: biopolymer transporter ExbD [Planctomycetota bacterium]
MNLVPSARSRVLPFEMTPMIDVVLQLIIFFLFTSQFGQTQSLELDLPEQPGEEREMDDTPSLAIDIDEDGSYYVDTKPVSLDRIVSMARDEVVRAGGNADLVTVLIRADQRGSARDLNRLATGLGEVGVRRWRLGTQPGGG